MKDNAVKPLKKKKGAEVVDYRPYYIMLIVVLSIALVAFYFHRVNQVKTTENMQTSYLLSSGTINLEIKNLEEVKQILSEAPNEYFVLINYNNNEDTYNLEKGLKTIIDKYALSDRFYYLNVTDIMAEKDYLARINNAFNTDLIKKVPTILYYKNGKIATDGVVMRADDNPINAGDFQKLLDIYEFEGQ